MVRTMTTSTFLDEMCMTTWISPAGKRHVGAWYGQVVCGAFVDSHNGWRISSLTSLRYLGRIAQGPQSGVWCKRCVNHYKDVNVNG